jgi:guanosine-3',5'-bis(diphosphate) 3'-pyrophosphohydrolase
VASHWRYKTDKTGEAPQQLARRWLVDLLETQQQAGNPTEFLEHLKTDLFPDEVYVFTPKGDIKKLPKGATALDFAFAVHSDIGKQCVAARVDHQLVPLHHVLRNGNHVEVVTSRSARPTPLWLNYVVTGKARAEIRSYLKSQREMDSVKLGKQLLDRTLKSIGHTTRLRTEQKIHLLRQLGKEDWNELLADLGTGKRLPMVVARQLLPLNAEELQSVPKDPLPIRGVEGMIITYARCCRPIPGDPITGVFSKGRGIVIHLASCPNFVEHGKHPENWLNVEWAAEVKGEFSVDIRLDTVNKPGVLAKLAAIIAEQQSNINNVSVVARDGRNSTIRFTIEVTDRVHLAQIMRKLRAQKSVIRLSRMKG